MWQKIKCWLNWHNFKEKCNFSDDETYKLKCFVRRKRGYCGKCQWNNCICKHCGKVKKC